MPNHYHFKNTITHPDDINNVIPNLIGNKVNYFADVFQILVSNWGNPLTNELENHKSLLEKVLFQLENHSVHSKKYIVMYFKNDLLRPNDSVIKRYYANEFKAVNTLRDIRTWNTDRSTRLKAIETLKSFIQLLETTLFSNALEWLVEVFKCKKPLDKHQHITTIEYLTSIIVSDFFYAGFAGKELDKIFRNITENKIVLKNGMPETIAPMPTNLHELKYKNENEYYEAVKVYLKKRSFTQQFEGIYNFYKNEQKQKTFIFRLMNIISTDKIKWSYENVLFSNNLYKENVRPGETGGKYAMFFSEKDKIFAQVSVKGTNNDSAKMNAIREISNAIQYLNLQLKLNVSVTIDHSEYIMKDADSNAKYSNWSTYLHKSEKRSFDNGNIYHFLRNYDNSNVRRLKEIDSIFISGQSSLDKDVRLVNLWRYLECFFEGNQVAKNVSAIVSKDYHSQSVSFYFKLIRGIFDEINNPISFEKIEVSKDEIRVLLRENIIKKIDLKRFSEIIRHPYLTPKIKQFIGRSSDERAEIVKNYYENILHEAYEQRNFIEHDGRFNEKSIDKVLESLPAITIRFRQILIKSAKKAKFNSMEEIVENLLNKRVT